MFNSAEFDIHSSVQMEHKMMKNYLSCTVIGGLSCGKTSLSIRIAKGIFPSNVESTIGYDMKTGELK